MMEPVDYQRATYAWRYPPRPAPKRSAWRCWGFALGLLFSIMMALALSHVAGKSIANLAHFNSQIGGDE